MRHVCRQQHLLATSQLQSMAKLLEDAAAGRYKRAVIATSSSSTTPTSAAATAAAASDSGTAPAASQADTTNQQQQPSSSVVVATELYKAAARQSRLVEVLQQLQQQDPSLSGELGRVMLHAAATTAWLQPQQQVAV